jgi:hypothetical protein
MDIAGKKAVVWGPLALVIHDCAAEIGFGVVGKPDEAFQGRDYSIELTKLEDSEVPITESQTLYVYYGPCEGESNFLCRSCVCDPE